MAVVTVVAVAIWRVVAVVVAVVAAVVVNHCFICLFLFECASAVVVVVGAVVSVVVVLVVVAADVAVVVVRVRSVWIRFFPIRFLTGNLCCYQQWLMSINELSSYEILSKLTVAVVVVLLLLLLFLLLLLAIMYDNWIFFN